MVKTESLSSNNKGIKQNISDDQIKSVLNELGFINFNKAVASITSDSTKKKTKKIQKGGEYFCVWTGTGEYTNKIWFAHSSDQANYKKYYASNYDCRDSALYIIYKEENKKLHSLPQALQPVKKKNVDINKLLNNLKYEKSNKLKENLIFATFGSLAISIICLISFI